MEERGAPLLLGILGSPRAQSNTEVLLNRVLAAAAAAGAVTDLIRLRGLTFESCRACRGCELTGRCVVQDDMQKVYPKLREARHIALASPIQFSGVSAETKAMIDRAQCCWVARYRLRQSVAALPGERRGLFVATCGGRDTRVFEAARPPVKAFFNSTGFRYWGELFEAGTDEPPAVVERADALGRAADLGRRIVSGR